VAVLRTGICTDANIIPPQVTRRTVLQEILQFVGITSTSCAAAVLEEETLEDVSRRAVEEEESEVLVDGDRRLRMAFVR
jgi:hypothetical protein